MNATTPATLAAPAMSAAVGALAVGGGTATPVGGVRW
jgi:hypothetical protein